MQLTFRLSRKQVAGYLERYSKYFHKILEPSGEGKGSLHSADVIQLLCRQPAWGCRAAVADAVVPCAETGGGAPGGIRSDL